MVVSFFVDRKINKFLGTLAKTLPKRYGPRKFFAEGQVRTTVRELGYDEKYNELALAVFCDSENYLDSGLREKYRKKYASYRSSSGYWGATADTGGFDGSGGDGGGGD